MRRVVSRPYFLSGCVLAIVGAVVAVTMGGDVLIAQSLLVAAFILLSAVICGVRGTLAALCILGIPPGVFGESSLLVALCGAAGLLVIICTYPAAKSPRLATSVAVAGVFSCCFIAMLLVGQAQVGALYVLIGICAMLVMQRTDFTRDACRGLSLVLGTLAFSYFTTVITGFPSGPARVVEVGERLVFVYAPVTLSSAGPPLIEGTRRFAPLVGEPGLTVFLLIPLLTAALTLLQRRAHRILAVISLSFVALATQSFGVYVAFLAGLALYVCLWLSKRGRQPLLAMLAGLGLLAVGLWFSMRLISEKGSLAPESVSDRGIFESTAATSASLGNINLIVAFQHSPTLAATLSIALVLTVLIAVRHPFGLMPLVMFLVTAVFSQPIQWQAGGWLLLVMAISISIGPAAEGCSELRSHRT